MKGSTTMAGQWHVVLPPISTSAKILDAEGYVVCNEIGLRDHAFLISAAPELLAALERLVSYAEPDGISIAEYDDALAQARAAIAKARP